ncbi:MAG: hypothetical protein AAFX85_10925, partial [Pseudomonadota bacterium]
MSSIYRRGLIGTLLILLATVGRAEFLDVDVPLFDENVPESRVVQREQGIYPQIRRVESQYFAVALARALVQTGEWGAVRVVPARDASAELTVAGRILRSDGRELELAIDAVDATGERWLAKTYYLATPVALETGISVLAVDKADPDALNPLFERIVQDLLAGLAKRSDAQRTRIREVSLLRYAAALVSNPFADYLEELPAGALAEAAAEASGAPPAAIAPVRYRAVRLPAEDDPMVRRIRRVRLTEQQLKDTSNQLYGRAVDDIASGYETWRRYNAQQLAYVEDREARLSDVDKKERKRRRKARSYASYKQSYEDYRWAKEQE